MYASLKAIRREVLNLKIFEAIMQKLTPKREADAAQAEKMPAELALLTPRERELFLLLLEGYTLKESANKLSVKYSTANTHMTGLYKKLGVNTRAELIIRYRDAVKKDV